MIILLAWGTSPALCFLQPLTTRRQLHQRIKATGKPFFSDEASPSLTTAEEALDFLQGAEILELTLPDHRPLGCTVEESLGKLYANVVFCSKVTPDGFAEKAGVKVGDVFLGVSGIFGNVEDVTSAGIERV